MNPEDLLKLLHDGGLDDEAVKTLLSDTLASLEGPAEKKVEEDEENKEKEAASKLLGVTL